MATPSSEEIPIEEHSEQLSQTNFKGEIIKFEIKAGKISYQIEFGAENTVLELKQYIEAASGIPVANQKLMFKGSMRNEATLTESGVLNGGKILCIGSLPSAIQLTKQKATETTASLEQILESEAKAKAEVPWCHEEKHRRVIMHGPPDGSISPESGKHSLPPSGQITGLMNSRCERIRIRFSAYERVMVILSDKGQEVLSYNKIRSVNSQPIEQYEGYFMMALKYGETDKHVKFIYFVPSQFVDAIKTTIIG
ncbi:putative Ubiquitin domain-containing protein UBFD1 [Monocercomonoides exilis]|uniref:putative Ubiquitin domain-containing protein UBFD1 n=1 Tax=Monocercomonoides exilis TaxID=2049356 RepID=UPI003559BC81|nr:putative Ubiquitin domain-containing protein UBFD1 [Monocercomonoides exilis]